MWRLLHTSCWLPLLLTAAWGLLLGYSSAFPIGPHRDTTAARQRRLSIDSPRTRLPLDAASLAALPPSYHVYAPNGWVNDPNAPLQYNGSYHLFFQLNPVAPVWGAPYWGHVVSHDLVHWRRLPEALVPDVDVDYDGVFSGSATLLADGTPAILYTGVSGVKDRGWYYQVQALAVPADPADPDLKRWRKADTNPIMPTPPPECSNAAWRDPTTAWLVGEGDAARYYAAVGAQPGCAGAAALYSSPDLLTDWRYEGLLLSEAVLSPEPGTDFAYANLSADGAGGGGAADGPATCGAEWEAAVVDETGFGCFQFGRSCKMWECPDFFALPAGGGSWDAGGEGGDGGEVYVVKYSDQVMGREPFALDWYVLSDAPPNYVAAATAAAAAAAPNASRAIDTSVTALAPLLGGEPFSPRLIDIGSVYASKSFKAADGRRLWWGWVYETPLGCVGFCGEGGMVTDAMGWQGMQTLPREVTYDPAARALIMQPVREVEQLRQQMLFNGSVPLAAMQQAIVLLPVDHPHGAMHGGRRQLELEAHFALAPPPASSRRRLAEAEFAFSVGALLQMGGGAALAIELAGTAAAAGDDVNITSAWLTVDTSRVGGATPARRQEGGVPLPAGGVSTRELSLRVLVDSSVVETFALGGRQRGVTRVYPQGAGVDWGWALFGNGEGSVDAEARVWALGSAWVDA